MDDDESRGSTRMAADDDDDENDGGGGGDRPAANRRRDGSVLLPRRAFWRAYDTVIMLSICSVVGIAIRMMSATWFRLELGAVFSEDSALGTNLPLNVWSCFLLGLLCSGRDAMGIVHSKVLGGANPHGSGRGILQVGMGAYRGIIDAGRAGINRARGRNDLVNDGDRSDDANSSPPSEEEEEEGATHPSSHGRRGDGQDDRADSSVGPSPSCSRAIRDRGDDRMPEYAESIAGLLGLDDEFRIAFGTDHNSEDEIRQVQLRGLSRRILASPSIAFFPARKEANDVL
ncbi:hypothetical protein ACHAW5_008916 [Stephanodiscus triporus]|uniref:Uncharacterized protein n=1 Tax=Stephanodiscus triporus TaxID=2934178 RepID=A0ABD3QAL1_9STRA